MFEAASLFACGDGALLFDGGARLVALDNRGAQIWRALQAGLSPDRIAAAMGGSGGDADRIRADVDALVDQWRAGGPADHAPADLAPPKPAAWAGEWRCRLRGAVVDVAVERPQHAQLMARWIVHFAAADGEHAAARIEVRDAGDGETITHVDGKAVGRGWGLRHANRALIMLAWAGTPFCAMAHAGAVGAGHGAICLAGATGSGKTTLLARLVSDGFDYLCDDLAPLTTDGRIAAWPMPVSVKAGSWAALGPHFEALEAAPVYRVKQTEARFLRLASQAWQGAPRPTRAIVFPRYRPGDTPEPAAISPIEALQRLVEAGLGIEAPIDAARIAALIGWLERTPAYSLAYGDVDAAAAEVSRLTTAP